tara:strand:+ start:657 stop:2261 length:1605 start_codon:yes stop_codon:yes gene_type:complete
MKLFNWLSKIGKRSSPENPSTNLANPDSWLVDWMGEGATDSGVNVTPETAMKFSAVFACVRVISETIASLPLFVYETKGRSKRKAREHSIYNLLHNSPNRDQTPFVFFETLAAHASLWGNGYAFIQRNNGAVPVELLPLLPDRTQVERIEGEKKYVTTVNGERLFFDPMDVLHIPAIGLDGMQGLSPIANARQAIGLGIATEQFGAKFFGNNANPSGILEHPSKLTPEARKNLRDSWSARHQGLENAHRVSILEEGMQWKQQSIPPEDAQFLQTRKFQLSEIARIFRVPPHFIGDLDKATFSNIEHQSIEFVVHTIRPWVIRIEQEINQKLFRRDEAGTFYAEFKLDGLLRGDTKSRYESYAIARNWGWLSANDIRALENMNPVTGLDSYLQPLNMEPTGGPKKQKQEPTPPSEGQSSLKPFKGLFQDSLRRISKREVSEIRRLLKKEKGNNWADSYYEEFRGVILTALRPVFTAFVESGGTPLYRLDDAVDFYSKKSIEAIRNCGTNFESVLSEWEENKSDRFANIFGGFENE